MGRFEGIRVESFKEPGSLLKLKSSNDSDTNVGSFVLQSLKGPGSQADRHTGQMNGMFANVIVLRIRRVV